MHRLLLIALLAFALAGGLGAYALGRSMRAEPPVPNERARVIEVDEIETPRWRLEEEQPPQLAPPDPTAAPATPDPDPGVAATSAPTSAPTTTTPVSPDPVVTSPPVVTSEPTTEPPPEPTFGSGTGGDP